MMYPKSGNKNPEGVNFLKNTNALISIIITIAIGVLLFQGWSKVLDFPSSFTLLEFSGVKDVLAADIPTLVNITLIIYVALTIISVFLLVIFVYKLITNYKAAVIWGRWATTTVIVLVFFYLISLLLINSQLKDLGESVFKATIIPYIILLLAAFEKLYPLLQMDYDAYIQKHRLDNSFFNLRYTKCENCGEEYDRDHTGCPKCGHKNSKS